MSLQNSGSTLPVLSHTDRLAVQMQDFMLLAGRVLFGWIFILSGWRKLMDIPAFVASMPRRDLPNWLGYIAPPVEFIGGILLVAGFATRYTALVMFVFLLFATFSSHRYWNFPEAQRANQYSHFWKNISMIGGSVLLFITGAGKLSLDAMLGRKR